MDRDYLGCTKNIIATPNKQTTLLTTKPLWLSPAYVGSQGSELFTVCKEWHQKKPAELNHRWHWKKVQHARQTQWNRCLFIAAESCSLMINCWRPHMSFKSLPLLLFKCQLHLYSGESNTCITVNRQLTIVIYHDLFQDQRNLAPLIKHNYKGSQKDLCSFLVLLISQKLC